MAIPIPDIVPSDEPELDQLVVEVRREWEELCDQFVASGELPHRHLAGRLEDFFESRYWRAIEAREELMRRRLLSEFPELVSSGGQ